MSMKKPAACLMALAVLFSLAGCKSTLRAGLEDAAQRYYMDVLDLSTVYDEENGFHYQNITWGMTLKEATSASRSSAGNVIAYGQNDILVYESGLRVNLEGRYNDSASLTTILEQSDVYMVSFVFERDSKGKTDGADITEKELFDAFLPKLREAFGEEDDYREETHVNERATSESKTYSWEAVTKDGKKTELQWSAAYVSGAEEPTLVSLGFVWYHDALDETEAAGEE